MGKIKNTSQVKTYNEPVKPDLKVHSHWNRRELVEIQLDGSDERIVVEGQDLIRAVENCMNVGRS